MAMVLTEKPELTKILKHLFYCRAIWPDGHSFPEGVQNSCSAEAAFGFIWSNWQDGYVEGLCRTDVVQAIKIYELD